MESVLEEAALTKDAAGARLKSAVNKTTLNKTASRKRGRCVPAGDNPKNWRNDDPRRASSVTMKPRMASCSARDKSHFAGEKVLPSSGMPSYTPAAPQTRRSMAGCGLGHQAGGRGLGIQ